MRLFKIKYLFFILFILNSLLATAQDNNDYVLGVGDSIHITVFQNPELTLDTRVPQSGNITFPLIGVINVGGLTVPQAEQGIAQALKSGGFFQKPQVSIVIVTPGNRISVLGNVSHPGRYALETPKMRLSDVLAMAGGTTPTGADQAIVIGKRNDQTFKRTVDIPSIFLEDNNNQDVEVVAGDEVYVHTAPKFYIYGEVQHPGSYRVERNMTVIQALAEGGGPTIRGTQRNIKLHRRDQSGTIVESTPKLTDFMQPDDVIYVRESLF